MLEARLYDRLRKKVALQGTLLDRSGGWGPSRGGCGGNGWRRDIRRIGRSLPGVGGLISTERKFLGPTGSECRRVRTRNGTFQSPSPCAGYNHEVPAAPHRVTAPSRRVPCGMVGLCHDPTRMARPRVACALHSASRALGHGAPAPLRRHARPDAFRGLPAWASLSIAGSGGFLSLWYSMSTMDYQDCRWKRGLHHFFPNIKMLVIYLTSVNRCAHKHFGCNKFPNFAKTQSIRN